MQFENLPFARGSTFFAGGTANATDGANLEGKEYIAQDENVLNSHIVLKIVRNVSGIALESKRLVLYKAGKEGLQVDGYARLPADWCFPVDDKYGGMTIGNNDLFFIVVSGLCLVKTSLAGNAENVLTVGDYVMSVTAATSQATTAGRLGNGTFAITGNTGPGLAKDLNNQIGKNLTTRTTNNTNTDTLVNVGRRW